MAMGTYLSYLNNLAFHSFLIMIGHGKKATTGSSRVRKRSNQDKLLILLAQMLKKEAVFWLRGAFLDVKRQF